MSSSNAKSTFDDCPVCYDKHTAQVRKPVKCPYCDFAACVPCNKKYLLDSMMDAHCMGCRRAWNDEFLDLNFTRAFRTGPWKKHREDVLMDREMALLPTRQPRVEALHKLREVQEEKRKINVEAQAIQEKIRKLREEQDIILAKSNRLNGRLTRYEHEYRGETPPAWTLGGEEAPKQDRAQFIMKCPDGECRGFLSTAYKCGTCQKYACKDCLEVLGIQKAETHTCNEEQKASVSLIIKESKPCPKCGTRISKIDGCFAKDTPILMWDGSLKMSQDICVGDVLIGDDGCPRCVTDTSCGEDMMYEVKQNDGVSYIVNSKHKLALKFSGDKHIYWVESENAWKMRWLDHNTFEMKSKKVSISETMSKENAFESLKSFQQTISFPEVFEITVEDYIKTSKSLKKHLMGFKSNGIDWGHKDVKIDPYLMGLYIGDGINDGMSFAISSESDPEIVQYLLDWCDENNCELVHDAKYRFRIRRCGYEQGRKAIGKGSSTECNGCKEKKCSFCDTSRQIQNVKEKKIHPLKEVLDGYDMTRKAKCIPTDYLVNDRETRLKVLGGIIDTDGHVCNEGKRIQITQANHSLANQIAFLARSLGFIAHVNVVHKKQITFFNNEPKDYSDQLCVNISGENIGDIPTKLPRKKCMNSTPNKDWLRTGIEVTPLEKGEYFGWSIDDNKRFILPDYTVVRNCDQMWCIDCHTAFSWATGKQVTGVVHNPHYYQYLRQQNGGVAPRNAGDVPCGGVPAYYEVLSRCRNLSAIQQNELTRIHRIVAEINDQRIQRYQGAFNENDNGDLGTSYLIKEITKEEMKDQLAKREVKRNREMAIRAVLEMFATTGTMMLNTIANSQQVTVARYQEYVNEFQALRDYTNESLRRIGQMKHCSVPFIDPSDWRWKTRGYEPTRKVERKPKSGSNARAESESESESDSDEEKDNDIVEVE